MTAQGTATAPQPPAAILRGLAGRAETIVTPVRGCAIHWRLWGSGRPLLLLHGNAGSWSHWARNIPFLARGHRVIAVDIPGFGDSGMPPEPYSADSIAALLREAPARSRHRRRAASHRRVLLRQQRRRRVGEAARPASSDPRRRLGGPSAPEQSGDPPFASWRKLSDPAARRQAHRRNLEVMMISRPERIDDLAIEIQSENTAKARLAGEKVTGPHPLRDDLTRLACPFSGIWGAQDRTIGPHMLERLALFAALGRAGHAHVIADAGHWHPYEAADAFNRRLAGVLAEAGR
ncbi:MAG: alpha/beta hydrolase [Pseudorhodoplanes sp.]|nr:alpha/beta hydrolase [Pseudorhodoplanes sp.]